MRQRAAERERVARDRLVPVWAERDSDLAGALESEIAMVAIESWRPAADGQREAQAST